MLRYRYGLGGHERKGRLPIRETAAGENRFSRALLVRRGVQRAVAAGKAESSATVSPGTSSPVM